MSVHIVTIKKRRTYRLGEAWKRFFLIEDRGDDEQPGAIGSRAPRHLPSIHQHGEDGTGRSDTDAATVETIMTDGIPGSHARFG